MPRPIIRRPDDSQEYWFDEGCHILEAWNTADDPALSVARARVPAGGATRWHCLRGVTERYLVQSGRGRVDVGDLPPTPVGPGDVVLIPAGCPQRIQADPDTELVFLALCTPRFTPDCYEDVEARQGGSGPRRA